MAVRWFCWVFACFAVLVCRGAEESVPRKLSLAMVDAMVQLGTGEARVVSGRSFQVGHASVTLDSGRVAPLTYENPISHQTECLGFFFSGSGSFGYASPDPTETPLFNVHVQGHPTLKAVAGPKGTALQSRFTTLLVAWAGATPMPAFEGPVAGAVGPVFAQHREVFGFLDVSDFAPLAHDFSLQKVNRPEVQLVRMEAAGEAESLLYSFDPLDQREERLALLVARTFNDPLFAKWKTPVTLSMLPLGRTRKDPNPALCMLTQVDLQLEALDANNARMVVAETLVPSLPGQRIIRLDLLNKVFDGNAAGNLEARNINVLHITDGEGRSLPFHHNWGPSPGASPTS